MEILFAKPKNCIVPYLILSKSTIVSALLRIWTLSSKLENNNVYNVILMC